MAADIGTPTLGDDSAYTLERVDSAGENTITNYEYDASTGDLTTTYYQVNLKLKEYGSGDSVKYYGWTKDSEGHNTFSEVEESAADVIVNYSTSNSQVRIEGQQDGADVTGNFTGLNGTANGSAINNSILGDITGDFTGNTANSSAHNVSGGAISHTEAGNITGNFTGNSVNTDYGGGGAIHYVITNDINGNFIGNNVNAATGGSGGAIASGDTSRKYGDIVGDFIGNYVQGSTTDSALSGGAIQNYGSTMGNITGNFIGNYVDADTGSVFGGAIWNRWWGNIGDIEGDFIGNYITTDNGEALGGAIGIEHRDAKIHSITGDFIGNYAEATNGQALGGAIFSNAFAPDDYPITHAISSIQGNFISNYVRSSASRGAAGGAIYLQNEYTIGTITGNFINNYIVINSSNTNFAAHGGAIYNAGSMDTITGDFAGNHIITEGYAQDTSYSGNIYGGAIYNQGDMTDIIGNFVNNYIQTEQSGVYGAGGAIYNSYSGVINNIKGGFYQNHINLTGGSAGGGAISNSGTIENIEGDFTGNSVWGRSANGGAIYNYGSWISTLTGNFTNNSATSELLNACGGAVYNSMGIGVITGDYTGNFVQGEGSAQGGALWNSQNLFITSNFSDNTAQGKYSAFGGAIYNTDALGGEMDYVQGEYKNNQALSENFAVGGAIYNGSEYSGEYAYIGTGDSNSGINGVFDGNKAIAAELQVPYALSINSLSPMSGNVAGDYNPYYGVQVTPHYAAGGAIYNNGVIKNIKGEYKNNFAGVSFNDRNALAEGGALLAKTDTMATEAFTDEYKLNGTINSPEVNSTAKAAAKQANVEPYVDGGGISGMGGVILKMDVKVGDEVKSVYRPAGDLSSNGINTIISIDYTNMPEDSGMEIPSFATEEEFNQYVAESGAVTNPDVFKTAYNKQIMTISANFDSNKAEAAVSGDARGGAISFVSTNDDLAHVTDSNGVSTYATAQPLPSWLLPSDSLIAHKNIIVDGESVAEFNTSGMLAEVGMLYPGSKFGYVNLLPEREYVIENSNFTNNQAVSNNGNAYGGGVSIVSNPGQLNAYAEEEVQLSEDEFIYDVQALAENYEYIVAPEGEITTKEQAVAYLNALTEKLKDTGAVIDNPQDSILEGYETVQSPKDKFIFKNTSFINNSAEAKGKNFSTAQGGAIYNVGADIGSITGEFRDNHATTLLQSDFGRAIAEGGAIYNTQTIGEFNYNVSEDKMLTIVFQPVLKGATAEQFSEYSIQKSDGSTVAVSDLDSLLEQGYKINPDIKVLEWEQYKDAAYQDRLTQHNEKVAQGLVSSTDPSANLSSDYIAVLETTGLEGIKADFSGNYVNSNDSANGGAIYNSGKIASIEGTFFDNHVSGDDNAAGGAIYNWNAGTSILEIKGDFANNSAESVSGIAKGGAISNIASSYGAYYGTSPGIIDKISGNFTGNYVSGSQGAFGGAIHTDGTINNIENSSFINNYAQSENGEAEGGAIYSGNDLTISANNGYVSEFTGNYVESAGEKESNAIHMGQSSTVSYGTGITQEFAPSDLTLSATENAAIIMNDKITGDNGYQKTNTHLVYDEESGTSKMEEVILEEDPNMSFAVNLTGDKTGTIQLNNNIEAEKPDGTRGSANVELSGVTLHLAQRDNVLDNNNLTLNSGMVNMINNQAGISALNSMTVKGDTSFVADVDLANKTMDRFTAENYGEHTGNVNVVGMNLLSDAKDDNTAIYFAQPGLKYNVTNGTGELPDSNQTTVYSPIYKYNVTYDNQNQYNGQGDGGYFLFSRGSTTGGGSSSGGGGGNPSDAFNPAVLSTSTSNLAASQAAMNEAFKYVFEHADAFTQLPANERYAKLNSNKYALSTDYNENMGRLTADLHNKGAWVRPYATFENMDLKHGPKVDAITYGTLVGFDTDFHEHRNGWHSVTTGYIGYNGSQLNYSGVDTTMNGGLLGVTQTYYKKNFWTALTLSAGASVGQSRNMYGKEDFTSLLAGIGSKTGYNFEFKDGKFILQPIMFMSYTFVNTFDYRNAAGVKIEADPMHSIQLNPQVRFIANMKNGWQPYASVGMVWNILNETSVTANNVRLPEMSIKPYVEYGVGVQKCFKDKYTGFMQAMVRNGGRNGVALTAGFRWALGEEGKPIEKVETKPVDEMSYEELRNKKKDRMSSLVPQISRYETGTARLGLMHGE